MGTAATTSGQLLDEWFHDGDPEVADRVAVATRDGDAGGWAELTYGDLDRRACAVSAWLADAGVAPGDRVALLGEPGGDWAAAFLAILRRGAIAVTLDAKLTADELAPLCDRSRLAAAIVSPALLPSWPDPAPVVKLSAPMVARGPRAAESSPADPVSLALGSPAVVVWTSGTTGEPKGVTLSFANLAYVVTQASAIHDTGPEARWLSVLPPNHLLELCCGLLPALAAASTTFVARTVVPRELITMVAECSVDRMVVVPLVLRLLKRHIEANGGTLAGLTTCYSGGAALDPEIISFFDRLGVDVFQGYGLTEASPTVSMNSPGHNRAGSVGRPLPGTEVRIAAGGEILVRGPGVMLGYWRDGGSGAATREVIDEEGWLHTGDLGFVDDEGYLFVTGRSKSLIVLDSGKKVQPEEVETALSRGGLFAEACVVGRRAAGVPGEQVCAVVVPASPVSQEEAESEVGRLTAVLSPFKRPTVVRVHEGELPKTAKRSFRRADIARMVEAADVRA